MGRQSQYIKVRITQVATTKVLRSMALGMTRVHQRLNQWRAMMLCWTAKRPSRPALIASVTGRGPAMPVSMDLGTTRLLTKPMAYRKVPRNHT